MSDKVAEELAALDKSLGLEVPEEETPPTDEAPSEEETAEEPTEEAPEEPEEEPTDEEHLYAGKFKSPEELERAYAELQSLEGRRSQELGELRKTVDQLAERIPEDDDSFVPMDNSTVQWLDTLIEENPRAAATWALENQGAGPVYDRVMEQWYDVSPRQAGMFERALEYRALQEQFSEQTQPLQEQAEKQEEQETLNEAWKSLAAETPDLKDYAEAMLEEAKSMPPDMLRGKTPEQKQAVLHTLYRLAKGSAATSLETAKQEAETETKEQNRAAKLSGTAPKTKAVTPESKSEDDQLLEAIPGFTDYLDKRSAPVE